jgi:hypothetical protein
VVLKVSKQKNKIKKISNFFGIQNKKKIPKKFQKKFVNHSAKICQKRKKEKDINKHK